jgi:1,4-alpha-glucan branching enzyme
LDFVLALHSHLPYVLHHGRWPHGSDWLCEAALGSYLPLVSAVDALAAQGVRCPLTIGVSPVLAAQLADPHFRVEFRAFTDQRLAACEEARRTLPETGDGALVPLVDFWETRFRRLRARFDAEGGDIVAAFARLQAAGHIELMTCAATHGYLPLLAHDASVRLQLGVARAEHCRLFGKVPAGCWLPECGYRPRGWWGPPGAPHPRPRAGTDEALAAAGFRYFFTDAHLAHAGSALGGYAEVPIGVERFDAVRRDASRAGGGDASRTPYRAYLVGAAGRQPLAVLVRDPRSSMQVWSRDQGYPGDGAYLEFHKIRWPGGLRFWRVTSPHSDLGAKQPWAPAAALARAQYHAAHFASLLGGAPGAGAPESDGVVAAPFDTELFGHWWFEGVDFLAALYRNLARGVAGGVSAVTAAEHLDRHAPRVTIELAGGSWGAGGDDGMWLNQGTAWAWERLWRLEERFWHVAPALLSSAAARPALAQAARELLLAQGSDWPFIITTGAVADYGGRRFADHAADAELLVGMLEDLSRGAALPPQAGLLLAEMERRDALFPEVLAQVADALEPGPRSAGA